MVGPYQSLRQKLAQQLAFPLRDFKLITSERTLDAISGPTILLSQQSIEPASTAPNGARKVTFQAILLVPERDLEKAEASLDYRMEKLLEIFDTFPSLIWTKADKSVYDGKYASYVIDFDVHTTTN